MGSVTTEQQARNLHASAETQWEKGQNLKLKTLIILGYKYRPAFSTRNNKLQANRIMAARLGESIFEMAIL